MKKAFVLLLLLLAAGLRAQAVILDNDTTGFAVLTGSWSLGTTAAGRYGADYRFASTVGPAAAPTATCEWRPNLAAGQYQVSIWYPQGTNRAVDSPFTIHHASGATTVNVNQTTNGGAWFVLGTFSFNAGTSGRVVLGNNAESSKVVLADAVRFNPVTPAADEFRAVWASRFEWPSTNPSTWKNNINAILNNAKTGNFNTVLLQMRGDTTTLYPSPYEPLSSLITLGAGDDPLAYAINAAHALGLKLHCYFNTHVCTSAFASANPTWIACDATGTPMSAPVDGYYWLAPGNPEVQRYLRTQIMHVVNTYPNLDGIHFDRIRMPEPQYSHDAVSDARRAGRGNPAGLAFDPWTADQITRWLRDVYAEVRSVNPTLQLSAAPLGLYSASSYPGYSTGYYYGLPRHQDAKAWLAAGALDWIAPQVYWADGGSKPDFSDIVPDWVASASGRHIYPGMSATGDASAAETISEINAARGFGCLGTTVWSYGAANSLNFWSALTAAGAPYQQPASPPALPWLANPTQAIVYGYVTNFATGQPVQDAWVTVNGQSYTALSARDGFWCWLKLNPGTYTFAANDPGAGSAQLVVSNLQAGEVRRVDIALATAGTAVRLEVQNAPVTVQAGQDFGVVIRVADNQGTLVTGGSYTIHAAQQGGLGTLTGTLQITSGGGYATFTLNYDVAEPLTLNFTDNAGVLTGTSFQVTFTGPPGSGGGGGGGGSKDSSGCALQSAPGMMPLCALVAALLRRRRRR
ncbi:MAG: family 10 glycosylhydrolase [Planctomycetes bacterium]|nr:family 10 glycosylhydrolase [Planctomycetota bacterium]MCL4731196.1 family 10 glycosylhydrolase [Planctomycetota bacterium]